MESFTWHSHLEGKKVKKKISLNLIPRHLASANSDHFVSKMQLGQGESAPDKTGSFSAKRWAGIWQGPTLATAQQSPAGSVAPAQVAQGWLRTQPDSGPSQPLAFMRFLCAQSQFSTLGERKQESSCHQPPIPKEKTPKSSQRQLAYLKYRGGWEFPWFCKKAQTPTAGTLLWTELYLTKFLC